MTICVGCGAEVPKESTNCLFCGTPKSLEDAIDEYLGFSENLMLDDEYVLDEMD